MPIRKQEFYEGAALHQLAQAGNGTTFKHDPPFFLVDNRLLVHLKYCTKGRSPWGFTFLPDEQLLLARRAAHRPLVIGLICGSDGIAAIDFDSYVQIVGQKTISVHVSCYRNHGQHYALCGPEGELLRKIPPSAWKRLSER